MVSEWGFPASKNIFANKIDAIECAQSRSSEYRWFGTAVIWAQVLGGFQMFCFSYDLRNDAVYPLSYRNVYSLAACLMKLIFLYFFNLGESSVEFLLKGLFLQSLLIYTVKSMFPNSSVHLLKTTKTLQIWGFGPMLPGWKSILRNMEDEKEENVQIPSG